MLTKIETKFDVGDIAMYEVQRYSSKFHGSIIPVEILRVEWFLSKHGPKVRYDCQTLEKSSVAITFPAESFINCGYDTDEKYFSKHPEHEPHPISMDFDTKYEFDQVVFMYPNDNVYGLFPPSPRRIAGFSYCKDLTKWTHRDPTINEWYSIRGCRVDRDTNIEGINSYDVNYKCIIDKLPDDYLEKCWHSSNYYQFFSKEGGRKTEHEKLFEYLGILDEAKEAYKKYCNKRFKKEEAKKPTKKNKIDDLIETLSESEKKELLKKLSK